MKNISIAITFVTALVCYVLQDNGDKREKLHFLVGLSAFHIDDVFIFSDLFKRLLSNLFSHIFYFSSTLHVSALALFTCDIQLSQNKQKEK